MTSITVAQFWKSIAILLQNFTSVKSTISACILKEVRKLESNLDDFSKDYSPLELQNCAQQSKEYFFSCLEQYSKESLSFDGFGVQMKLITKKQCKDNVEALGIVDFRRTAFKLKFNGCSSMWHDFCIELSNSQLKVYNLKQSESPDRSSEWLDYVLKPKLENWCKIEAEPKQNSGRWQSLKSLQLVDIEEYTNLYKMLKVKYAEKASQLWLDAKENTDPQKFIHEDLAIAAYLITLWQRSDIKTPTAFADLGCGNGLLVYILCEEGYPGYGYDIRARRLWSFYPPKTHLLEEAINPESFKLPTEVDWLIGNHSDELSPWLPVMATYASYDMCYFLLPCCAYEFSGDKYQRRDANQSVYHDFLSYATEVSHKCGFITLLDRLKIPSTKRIALIGQERTGARATFNLLQSSVRDFVNSEKHLHGSTRTDQIKLREKHEPVRNCTQVDASVIDALVLKIFKLLLNSPNLTENYAASETAWRPGGSLTFAEIANNLTREEKNYIKSECGGIKTLLRNKREIFELHGKDLCRIRRPKALSEMKEKPKTIKKRQCFFKSFHPNSCPLPDEECSFVH